MLGVGVGTSPHLLTASAAALNTGAFYVSPSGSGGGLSPSDPMSVTALNALGGSTLSGKTVVAMPGTFSTPTLSFTGNAATVTIIPRDPANPPIFDQLTLSAVSKVKFAQGCKLASSAWSSTSNLNNPAVFISGACGALTFDSCTFKGNYRGDISAAIDTVNELPEYACVSATMSGGAVTALTIPHPYVGDLLSPGTYSLALNETGGTGFSATFTVTNTTINGVTGNFITSTNLVSGGSGYAGTLNPAARLTWTGQHRMVDYIVEAMRTASGGSCTDLTINNCTMNDVRNGCKAVAPTNTLTLTGNTIDRFYESGISVGLALATAPPVTIISDNFGTRGFYKSDDAGNPHGGFLRPSMQANTPSDWIITADRNIYIPGGSRGVPYFALFSDCPTGIYFRAYVRGNMGLSNGGATGFAMDGMRDCYIARNTWVRFDPSDADTASVSVTLPEPAYAANAAGKSYVGLNITENLTNENVAKIVAKNNVRMGTDPGAAVYSANLSNPTSLPATKAAALAAFAPSAANAGKGAGGSDGYLDYTNNTLDKTKEPTFVSFDGIADQLTNTAVSSAWCRVLGGPDTQSWSITGGTAQVADDASGTNATVAAASGTVARDKFMRINTTTSSSGSTTVKPVLTINGYTFTFAATTQSTASFATADNQVTAWSKTGTTPTKTGIKRALIAVRKKTDTIVSGANIFCDASASGCRLYAASSTTYRLQFVSGKLTYRTTLGPTTNWETHLIALDFTATTQEAVAQWYVDQGSGFVNVPIDPVNSTVDVTGTASLSLASQIFAGGSLGVLAKPDGTGVLDGQIAYLFMHFGDATFTLPDITDPAVQNMFTADNINLTNGSGPLGFQPDFFWYGAGGAADWNAGLANKGAQTLSLTKQAGTYA